MYAVIKTGGKQYKVEAGQKLRVEKLNAEVNAEVTLEEVLLVANEGDVKVGKPFVEGAKVLATVVAQDKAKKVINFKYKPKKSSARKKGHRQLFTEIEIKSIEA
jgi:large subunit ribosomal protein L21